jgi:cytochrome b subunit of formate dehydrogenase
MNRSKLNYYVDIALTVLFIIVAITGFVLYLGIPSGVRQGRYQEFIGITKATWTLIHNRSSILLTLFTALHFVLHKKWMCCMTRNLFKREEDQENTECGIINIQD